MLSVIKTNESVEQTNTIQVKSLWATFIILVIGTVTQIYTCNITKDESKQNKERIKEQLRQDSIVSLMSIDIRVQIDSILKSKKTDTLKVSLVK